MYNIFVTTDSKKLFLPEYVIPYINILHTKYGANILFSFENINVFCFDGNSICNFFPTFLKTMQFSFPNNAFLLISFIMKDFHFLEFHFFKYLAGEKRS